ncbi:MAG: hypothetical protein AAF657_07990, partial [Acidobacteriota bacterium]
MSTNESLPVFRRAADHGDQLAVVDNFGTYTYRDLLDASHAVAAALLAGPSGTGPSDTGSSVTGPSEADAGLAGTRVALLLPPGFHFVAAQWGIWRAGGIAVPLALSHPPTELAYV